MNTPFSKKKQDDFLQNIFFLLTTTLEMRPMG